MTTAPVNKAMAPANKVTAPVNKATAPVNKATAPANKATAPVNKALALVNKAVVMDPINRAMARAVARMITVLVGKAEAMGPVNKVTMDLANRVGIATVLTNMVPVPAEVVAAAILLVLTPLVEARVTTNIENAATMISAKGAPVVVTATVLVNREAKATDMEIPVRTDLVKALVQAVTSRPGVTVPMAADKEVDMANKAEMTITKGIC
jgi:hypothetical protein